MQEKILAHLELNRYDKLQIQERGLNMTRNRFFLHTFTQFAMGFFFTYLATLSVASSGWNIISFFCCFFATNTIVTALKMVLTYRVLRRIQKEAEKE